MLPSPFFFGSHDECQSLRSAYTCAIAMQSVAHISSIDICFSEEMGVMSNFFEAFWVVKQEIIYSERSRSTCDYYSVYCAIDEELNVT